MSLDLFQKTRAALLERDPSAKVAAAQALKTDWDADRLDWKHSGTPIEPVFEPGRPDRPILVSPRGVERRHVGTLQGRAALIHAIAHIEFNAINLALDAAYRFRGLPREYYRDWITVATEEALHFTLLRDHLRALGYDYGSFSAHSGLWDMAVKTAHDPLVRMALVPRVLEARGLDVSPALIVKLRSVGDTRAADIMEIIQRDEIGHVRIGSRWYAYLCRQQELDPVETFRELIKHYGAPRLRQPLNVDARRQAGFRKSELALLERLANSN
jgi:uncharacterized ferritin-like protein (DUF455 family)